MGCPRDPPVHSAAVGNDAPVLRQQPPDPRGTSRCHRLRLTPCRLPVDQSMKFGKNLLTHQIPQWLVYYINYKALKKIINHIATADDLELVLLLFFYELDRNVENVDDFYSTKLMEYGKRMRRVVLALGYNPLTRKLARDIELHDELDEVVLILREMWATLRNLQWFGEINYRGFVKILKKLDKKLGDDADNKATYLLLRIDPLPFARGKEVQGYLDTIHAILVELGASDTEGLVLPRHPANTRQSEMTEAIQRNHLDELRQLLTDGDALGVRGLTLLLIKATTRNAPECIDVLIEELKRVNVNPFVDKADISRRTFFHQLIIHWGKHHGPGQSCDGLSYVLAKYGDIYQHDVIHKDLYHRTPVHYAAEFGLKDAVVTLITFSKQHHLIGVGLPLDHIDTWGDQDGMTPLHLAVLGHHPQTTRNLIRELATPLACSELLLLAARNPSPAIVEDLVTLGGIDVNYSDDDHHGETALHIACKYNHVEVAEFLLSNDADPEIGESVFGWTPIFIAANEGYTRLVKLLLEFGAKVDTVDDSGWLPMEHLCLRGHLDTAELLRPQDNQLLLYDMYSPENNVERKLPEELHRLSLLVDILPEHLRNVYNKVFQQLRKHNKPEPQPIKLFGHRYLSSDESMVLITLGLTDMRQHQLPVTLHDVLLPQTLALDTALLLLVTCKHRRLNQVVDQPVVVDLPLDDFHASATDPITFAVPSSINIDDLLVSFDLVPTYQFHHQRQVLGRAVAFLKELYTPVGPHLRSLHRTVTLPIMDRSSMDTIGEVRFEYLPITSFGHPAMAITPTETYWKQLVSTRVIGHRGLGKNFNRKLLQLGENTVELFIAAASLGALYVEFDVQLTKDMVPVVYHDFTVAELGVDIPMNALTLEQFLGLNEEKSDKEKHVMDDAALIGLHKPRLYPLAPNFHAKRTASVEDAIDVEFRDTISRRMKLTKTWKSQGFKGNARGLSVALSFVTLEELFRKLPSNVGFNIELKYPMLDEAEMEQMGEVAVDLNTYVDTILKVIYDANLTNRDILFSLFHPDVCVLLSLKQPLIPILFLSEAGTAPMADIRALLLQNAIRFAKKWNLLGIVLAAGTLVKCPRLAQVVKLLGLVCVTYGVENNDPELAKIQMKAGVDAVIADLVLAVREGIRKDQEKLNELEELSRSISPAQTVVAS